MDETLSAHSYRAAQQLLDLAEESITADTYEASKARLDKLCTQIIADRGSLSDEAVEALNAKMTQLSVVLKKTQAIYHRRSRWKTVQQKVTEPFAPSLQKLSQKFTRLDPDSIHQAKWMEIAAKADIISAKLRKTIGVGADISGTTVLEEQYWGEVLEVSLDDRAPPIHIYGQDSFRLFKDWTRGWSDESFSDHVKSSVSRRQADQLLQLSNVRYLKSKAERADYVVSVDNGLVTDAKGKPLHGHYMYALDPEGQKLYMGKKERGHFHHSSFLGGGAVKSAGFAEIVHGTIIELDNSSGHYAPTSTHLKAVQDYLASLERLGPAARAIPLILT